MNSQRSVHVHPISCSVSTAVLAIAGLLGCGLVHAQATSNLAPRISLAGVVDSVRADTLCLTMAAGGGLAFGGLEIADADVGASIVHARVELEPGGVGSPFVLIPDLSAFPGVTILREEPDRIRFNAPLASVNAALDTLQYQSGGVGIDLIDIIVDDLQLPPLSAELRFYVDAQAGAGGVDIVRCRPPPDLRADSDTGNSNEDDITAAPEIAFDVSGIEPDDVVVLMNDDIVVAQIVATGNSVVIIDDAPLVGETGLYAVSVNGDLGSAAWSVAIVASSLFSNGFESPPP